MNTVSVDQKPSLKEAFLSWSNFKEYLKVEDSTNFLINIDILPTGKSRRIWNWLSFFCYWYSESWAVSTWSLGSTMVAAGLTVAESIILIFFSNLILSIVCVINGRAASTYHIGYPVLARATFGIYAHYFFIILRAILGIIWGGVQLYFEGQFISIALRCIFPGWEKIPNHIPASQYIDVQTMLGFFFAFLITMPFLFVHTYKLRHLFTVKSFCIPFAGLGIVIWAAKVNGGISANTVVADVERGSTTAYAFTVFSLMNSIFGASSALLVTIPDLARYSTRHRDQIWGQMFGLPVAQTICATFGILTTAALKEHWGEVFWNPYDLLNAMLDHGYTSPARAGVFFASVAFAFATLGTSIACNIVPFAADVTSLCPKYINIVRGQILCLIIAFAIVPWRILTSATTFLNFLGGYSIFQGSVVGIMSVDYFFSRKGNLNFDDLYTFSKSGRYYFTFGVNWRSIASFVIGFALPFPGFVAVLAEKTIGVGAIRLYDLGWLLSITTGALSYAVFTWIWPVDGFNRPFEADAQNIDELIEAMDNNTRAEFLGAEVQDSKDQARTTVQNV